VYPAARLLSTPYADALPLTLQLACSGFAVALPVAAHIWLAVHQVAADVFAVVHWLISARLYPAVLPALTHEQPLWLARYRPLLMPVAAAAGLAEIRPAAAFSQPHCCRYRRVAIA